MLHSHCIIHEPITSCYIILCIIQSNLRLKWATGIVVKRSSERVLGEEDSNSRMGYTYDAPWQQVNISHKTFAEEHWKNHPFWSYILLCPSETQPSLIFSKHIELSALHVAIQLEWLAAQFPAHIALPHLSNTRNEPLGNWKSSKQRDKHIR